MTPGEEAMIDANSDDDQRYWERNATRYDWSLKPLRKPLPRMLHLVGEATAGRARVLEVAAGTGLVTPALSKAAEVVVSTDYAGAMVDRLRRKVEETGLHNVECRQADLYALPFPPRSFDAVIAANVLHLVPDFEAAVGALGRMLRPDGIMVLPTFCHDQTKLSWVASRLLAITGFPGHRRFTLASLGGALAGAGVDTRRSEVIGGLIPIGYVDGVWTQ